MFSHEPDSPERVAFTTFEKTAELSLLNGPVIALVRDKSAPIIDDRFSYLNGTPTGLEAIALTTTRSSPLSESVNRRKLGSAYTPASKVRC